MAKAKTKPNPVGAPSIYTNEIAQEARNYIATYENHNQVIPSVVGLAAHLNVARSTLYKWAQEDDKELSDILENLKDKQHETLINKGLSGDFNPTITKLILTKHGYSDRQELDHSGHINDYSGKSPDELARLIEERQQAYLQSKED